MGLIAEHINAIATPNVCYSFCSHSEAIQCLAYNPVTFHLASCALTDFAFWSMDVKAVQKFRVQGRITSCAWSSNGQFLAIGLAIGAVSVRDKVSQLIHLSKYSCAWECKLSFGSGLQVG